jgi:peptide/nickel transport system permease protein
MIVYILRRLVWIIVTLLLASMLIFAITQLLPGDVARVILGQFATPTAIENLRAELGLDRPVIVQYLDWLLHFVSGDWGNSLVTRMPVRTMVLERLRNSLMLGAVALILYVPLGIFLGVFAALREDRPTDQVISAATMAFVGLPEFVTGLILIGVFSLSLDLLPANSSIAPGTSFKDAFPSLILPAITVGLISLGYVVRMTRSSTIEVLHSDYVRAADLKGLPRRQVLIKHVLRNSLLPTVTVIAIGVGFLIGGLIVTESVFGYPGLGRLLVYGIQRRDLPLIQATTMVIVAIFSLSNLAADILYSLLNPRIRLGS